MSSLKGKVALITGSTSGIGAETARHFASLGCYVSLTGRREKNLEQVSEECQQKGLHKDKILLTVADLWKEEDVKRIADRTLEHFEQIDVLVNNAGLAYPAGIEDCTLEQFDKTFDLNVRAPLQLTHLLRPHLIKTKGAIVNVSSVNGVMPFPWILTYCMSKSAIDSLTLNSAHDLAPHGVRVNSVNPGVILTEVHRSAGMNDQQYEAFLEKCKHTHAMGRVGTVDEVAKVIAFLASDASSFVTGELVTVDGGRHLLTTATE
ncbi:3-oxoacyl-[acyl-carrier-protein] reductase FabG-like [Asterias rubens]|uniref:3-oxoacyl-[acyl-carrier-protein] reductase FabG-like n=1 Tax=Asterias rubens TaxID=7604 RepID=UPI0014554430|nr:3-oxoacyl-[acyl-carrier-protein] reductase FabG-like [Asterias rubens]